MSPDSLAASSLWKKTRVEVRGAESEPANSCGDGPTTPLANQLHEQVQTNGIHSLQGRATGAPGGHSPSLRGVSGM